MNIKKKIILTLIILTAAVFAIIFFAAYPIFSSIKKESQDIVYQKSRLLATEDKVKNFDKLLAAHQKHQEYFKKINSLFINPQEPIGFIEFLETEAAASKISINISLQPLRSLAGDPWPSVNFQLTTEGAPQNFFKFLERMGSSPYLIEILNLDINQESASILMKVYAK